MQSQLVKETPSLLPSLLAQSHRRTSRISSRHIPWWRQSVPAFCRDCVCNAVVRPAGLGTMKNNDDSAGNRAGDKRPRSAGDSTGGTEGKRARGEGDGGRTCPACKRTFGSGIDMRQHYSCKQDAVHVEHRRLHVRQEDKDEEARPLGGMAPAPALQAHAAAPVVKANPSARTSSTTLSQMTAARFADLTINPLTKKAIAEVLRYETMTLVQQQSLPVALSGVDVLAKAKTGTGKTLSFLLPALEAALRPPSGGPRIKILIVSPTRELASQIYEEGQMVCKFHSGFKLMCIYGGTNMNKDINGFKAPPDLLVATPGRLNDHLQSSGLDRMMLGLRVLILDEADQLLDMGFRPAILDMLSRLPPKESRQTLLFSATMPNDVQSIAKIGMRANYSFVDTVCRSPPSCLPSPACTRYPPCLHTILLPVPQYPITVIGYSRVHAGWRCSDAARTRRARTAAELVWCRWERRRTRTSTCRSTTSSPPSSRRPRSSWGWSRKPCRSPITR